MSADLHSPTTAGPMPPAPGASGPEATADSPLPAAADRPEVQAGLAFAGGLLAAMFLKRITR